MKNYQEFINENKKPNFNDAIIKRLHELVDIDKIKHMTNDESHQVFFIDTIYGLLEITLYGVCCRIFMKFRDPLRAKASVGCNTLTGAWNVHAEDAKESLRKFTEMLKSVLPKKD